MAETLNELLGLDDDDLLIDDDLDVDWDAVIARLGSHPHEATIAIDCFGSPLNVALTHHRNDNPFTVATLNAFIDSHKDAIFDIDKDGHTTLHVACWMGLSAEVVRSLLEANPDAASVRAMNDGAIPLHFAHNPEVVNLLLQMYPEGVGVVDNTGWLPLHFAAINAGERSQGILPSLLQAGTKVNVGGVDGGGGLFIENKSGKTPLMLACDRPLHAIHDIEYHSEDYVNLLWEKVHILARAASSALAKRNDNADINEDGPLLHALVASKCPQFVILRTLSANPNLTTVRDSLGRTPLAIAASQHDLDPEIINLLLGNDHFDSRIAGMATKEKRLPLHLAAEIGWEFEYLEKIRQAAPAALETRDLPTRMYPFMLAAEGDHSNLNSVYQLLRASPRMAHGMAEGIHWENSKLRLQCENREQRDQIAELEGENSELKKSNVEHLRKIAEQAKENARLEEEIRKLRKRNYAVMDDSFAKWKKIGD